jgi:hypothetical protein
MYMPAFQAKKLVKAVSDETEVSALQGALAGKSRESASLTLTAMTVVGPSINLLKSRLSSNKTPSAMAAWLLESLHHHGIVSFSQRVNLPVGPSGPSSATRTASRAPSSTVSVPEYPLRFVLV